MIADLENPEEIFEDFVTSITYTFDPRTLFMILAIILFLADLAVRKFKFKWPHELIQAWKEKMEKLNMHGNQLLDRDGELCNMLNVNGIPFFVVYDKNGKLHTYGALRPSSGERLKKFLQELP